MNLTPFAPALSLIEIILAISLVVLVLFQTRGNDLGGFFGGGGGGDFGSFRTRRGIEATLHRVTIACSILFMINTVFTFLAMGQ
ncbi:MAG: preprotein translocase subunit SecG [Chloroflexota bacterium]